MFLVFLSSSEHFRGTFHACHEGVDLLFGVIESEGCPHGSLDAERCHDGLRTVMAGAHSDAEFVEDGAEVVRVDIADEERDESAPLLRVADESYVLDPAQLLLGVSDQLFRPAL